MGRFTAWIASRRKKQPRQAAGASGGRAARSLGFERCEQRIALSTNAGFEPVPLTFHELGGNEGGFIVLTNGAGVTVAALNAGIARAFSSEDSVAEPWTWTNAYDSSYQLSSGASLNGLLSAQGLGVELSRFKIQPHSNWGGSDATFAYADFDLAPAGILITESNVVPIPPPAAEGGGNEGGQISMMPFIGPSMLGPSTANEPQLAVRTRHALSDEPLDAPPAVGSAEAHSLRGRAVVYEVAHSRAFGGRALDIASTPSKLDPTNADAVAQDEFEFIADGARPATSNDAAQAAFTYASVAADQTQAARAAVAADRPAAEIVHAADRLIDDVVAARADEQAPQSPAEVGIAAAHDAAIEQFEQQFEPIREQGEAIAATVDAHGKRVLGGALIAVAAIPVAKSIRRHAQRPVEARPRQTAPAK